MKAMTAPAAHSLPEVPLTLEGASLLHQMLRVRWTPWKQLDAASQRRVLDASLPVLEALPGSAAYSVLGHKADFLLIHFHDSFAALNDTEFALARTPLWDFLELTTSYLSVVELGLYESSQKAYESLAAQGLEPHSEAWSAGIAETLDRQRKAMHPRLFPEIPPQPYVCFYPMDRRRGELKNWYQLPMAERARQMHEHGLVGRRYAGRVKQIISGSIGFDDWEWGVDLFADDPLVFKQLIYEMRFDEVSAMYALFGSFYVGLRRTPAQIRAALLSGSR